MFKIKEAAMDSVTRRVTSISVTALTLESGCSTFIKHRFPAVGRFRSGFRVGRFGIF